MFYKVRLLIKSNKIINKNKIFFLFIPNKPMFYKVRLLIKSNKIADDCQIEY